MCLHSDLLITQMSDEFLIVLDSPSRSTPPNSYSVEVLGMLRKTMTGSCVTCCDERHKLSWLFMTSCKSPG